MAVFESEDRLRQRRQKSEQAISLAMKSRWDEAVQVNREILERAPADVEANNRLGKALTELGRYAEARDAYAAAVKADPSNGIATRNLQRLTKLVEEGGSASSAPAPVDPRLFIEESGKTTVTQLTDLRRGDTVVKLSAGDQLQLEQRAKELVVLDQTGEVIGRIEPKLEQNLIRLLGLGNHYSATVRSVTDQSVSVIIRETYRTSAMGNRPSFRPTAVVDSAPHRAYAREGLLRYDVDEEDEDEDDEDDAEVEVEADVEKVADVEVTPIDALAAAEDEEPEEAT